VAAPAVAQVILAGVVASVGDSHQKTSSEELDIVTSPVRGNECTKLVELSGFFEYFQTSRVHPTLHALALGGGYVSVASEGEGGGGEGESHHHQPPHSRGGVLTSGANLSQFLHYTD